MGEKMARVSQSIVSVLTCSLILASTVSAHEKLDEAYGHYQMRDEKHKSIKDAKEIYFEVLKDNHETLEHRRTALDKYARLTVFEGEVGRSLFDVSNKDAARAFDKCIEATDYLNPKKIKTEIPEYIYWRAMCIGLWAANVNPGKLIFKASRVKELSALLAIGLEKYDDFDGFGFKRIQAGMLIRSKFLSAFDLYHPDQAIDIINKSLKNGTDIFMTYILKAEAQGALGQDREAQQTLEDAEKLLVKRLAERSIPTDLVAENKMFLQQIRNQRQKLQ